MNGEKLHVHSRRPFPSVLMLALMLCLTGFGERALFAQPVPQVRFDPGSLPVVPPDVPPQALIGEPFTFKVRFKNAGGAIGYGPFIDLVLDAGGANITKNPPCPCDGMTLSLPVQAPVQANMIDINGGAVPLVYHQSVAPPCAPPTAPPPPPGHLNHPFSGVLPVLVPAGSQLVTIELPFGSFDPTQPEIVVEVTAYVSPLADVNWPLKIYARGGFRYGFLDALDDPITDPPILSEGPASILWIANAQTTPTVIIVSKEYLGPEDENATGPNFTSYYPLRYKITIDIALNQVVTFLRLEDTVPQNMVFDLPAFSLPTGWTSTAPLPSIGPSGIWTVNAPTTTPLTGVLGPDFTVVVAFYVPERDANHALVLPDNCDYAHSINTVKALCAWQPLDPCDGGVVALTSTAQHDLLDKCLAIQKTVVDLSDPNPEPNNVHPIPGDTLLYTLNFQISDFKTMGNLHIVDLISDGQTLDPAYNPTLTVTDQCGTSGPIPLPAGTQSCGTGAPPPRTELNFDISGAMSGSPRHAAGILTGGWAFYPTTSPVPATGTITFQTVIDDQYQCPVGPGDQFVDKDDPLTNTVTLTADILANSGTCSTIPTPTGFSAQDGSNTVIAIATDFLVKTVYAVMRGSTEICGPNTTPCPSKPEVIPGDAVTFRLKKTIPSSDAENLTIQDWLPLPIFLVAGSSFIDSPCVPTVPNAGQSCLGPDNTLSVVPTYTGDGATNSFTFGYGTFNYLDNVPRTIDLLFTRAVTNTPFADGLYLTNEAKECESNTFGVNFCQTAIAQVHVREPALTITKGVVAASNSSAVFTPTLVGPVPFNPPGSSCTTRFTGTINSTGLASAPINSDISSVDANDCVTFAIVVENTGGSAAYDVQLGDVFPLGPTGAPDCFVPDFTTLCVTDGTGALLPFTPGTVFPITLSNPLPEWSPTSGLNIAVITFEACIVGDIKPHCCDNTASVEHYASTQGGDGVSGPNFVGSGFGGSLQDTAQLCVLPTAAKSIVTTSEPSTPGPPVPPIPELAIGEIIRYHLRLGVPETTSQSSYHLNDVLPAGLRYVGGPTNFYFPLPSGVTAHIPPNVTGGSGCGSGVTFDFGTVTNSNAAQEFIDLEFNALVCNIASNLSGTTLNNSFDVIVTDQLLATSNTVSAVVVEPKLTLTKTVSPNPVVQGGTVTYIVTITNTGTATAFDVAFADTLPNSLTPVTNLTYPLGWLGGIPGQNVNVTCLSVNGCSGLAAGGVASITYQAIANPTTCPVTLTNRARVTWTSLPGPHGTTSNPTGSSTVGNSGAPDGERDGSDGPNGVLNNYAAFTSASLTVNCPPCFTPPSGMVAWYPLDEFSGAIPINDIAPPPSSLVNNVGTPHPASGPAPVVVGEVAGAMYFAGQYEEVLPNSELDFGRGDFSIDAWVRPVDCSHGGGGFHSPIVDKFDGTTTGFAFYLDQPTVGVAHLYLNINSSPAFVSGGTIPTLVSATWSHIAVTVARPLGGLAVGTFYINGLPAGTFTPPAGSVTNTLPMWIGKTRLGGSCEIAIDELEIFNRALGAGEIKSIADAKSAGKCKCLLISGENIVCNRNGTFTYTFTLKNLSGSTVDFVNFLPIPPLNVIMTPGAIPTLPPGASATVAVTISGPAAVSGAQICFTVDLVALVGPAGELICSKDHCITLPKCCVQPPPGMVAWWPLDETSGTTVADIAGHVPHNNGTSTPQPISAGGPYSVPAKVNNGFRFCGGGFVAVGDSTALNFGTAQSFSIDAWIETSGVAGFDMIVDKLDWPNPSAGYRFYVDNTSRLKFDMGPGAAFVSTTVLTPGNWYYVAVTVDRPTPRVIFYINGTPEVVGGNNSFNASNVGLGLLIGGTHETQLQLGCEFILDEVEIFNGVLTQDDISAMYNADSSGKCKPGRHPWPVLPPGIPAIPGRQ